MKRSFFQYVSLNVLGALGLSGYILADTLFVAHRLGSGGGTVIFGAVGGEQGDSLTVRLTYGGGQSLTQRVYPGQTFHFLLEGSPALEKLELFQGGQVLDGCTGLS